MRRVCVFCMRVAFINTQTNKRDATRRSCIRVRNDENLRLVIVASRPDYSVASGLWRRVELLCQASGSEHE